MCYKRPMSSLQNILFIHIVGQVQMGFSLSDVKMNSKKDERHTVNNKTLMKLWFCLAVETGIVLR